GVDSEGNDHGRPGEYLRGEDVAHALFPADFFQILVRLAIELPDQLAGRRLERVEPPVPARKDHLTLAIDHSISGRTPLRRNYLFTGGTVLPDDFSGGRVDGNEAWGLGIDDLIQLRIVAVPGHDVNQIPDDDRRTDSRLILKRAQFLSHVQLPDELAILNG